MSRAWPLGDRGQRFEVVQILDDGTRRVWGWTNETAGGRLADAARKHPDTKDVLVVDREGAREEEHEPDYGGVLGADGQVHSDVDPGL